MLHCKFQQQILVSTSRVVYASVSNVSILLLVLRQIRRLGLFAYTILPSPEDTYGA